MEGSILLWIIVGAAAIAADIITSVFLFMWFALGAIAAIIALMLNFSFTTQLIVFLLVSVVSMLVGYPIVKRTLKKSVTGAKTTEQGYIGRKLTADEEITERARVKVDGIYWTVKKVGRDIDKGDRVEIVGLEGNKLLIKKVDKEGE
jgi:membrane protein implicated in regulation of membrane protease activity